MPLKSPIGWADFGKESGFFSKSCLGDGSQNPHVKVSRKLTTVLLSSNNVWSPELMIVKLTESY